MKEQEAGKTSVGVSWLSPEARSLYTQMADGLQHVPGGTPGLAELLERELILANHWKAEHYVLLDRGSVFRRQAEKELRDVQETVARILNTAQLVEELPQRTSSEEGGMKFLATIEECRAAIVESMHDIKSSVWTAQPVDRTPETMETTKQRDLDNLARGIRYRTIYLDSARHQPHQKEWAEAVTERGAEVRTLPGGFHRMVLVDAGVEGNPGARLKGRAIISDHRPGPGYLSRNTGWLVTNPGMVAQLAAVYQEQWNRADPWTGGYARFSGSADFTSDDEKIFRGLLARRTNEAIASELGVDLRTVTNRLGRIYRKLNLKPGDKFSLGMAYERHLAQVREQRNKSEA
ncbi:hypothetical protein [Streptomyces sp. NPDC088707]|uniref:hypothetical protein n=1 Tax=Streptomyces sp. NPDC088707 TaxID=3365871 RepID=UPI00381EB02A